MRFLTLCRKKIEPLDYLGTFADPTHASQHITDDTVVVDETGKPILAYIRSVKAEMDVEPLRAALTGVPWAGGYRATVSAAVKSVSKVFGYQPRLEIRNTPCRIAGLALEKPEVHRMLEDWTRLVTRHYEKLAPHAAEAHRELTASKIKTNFHLAESMFTSGIINKSNVLPYHFDSGNFDGAWSAMLGLRQHVNGGMLVIPEYDIALEIADGSLSFFDGQSILHGVTPMEKRTGRGERYTIVWYSLKKMWLCLTTADEVKLMNERGTANALKRAAKIAEGAD